MSINILTASGNISKDCVVRYTQNKKAIATFNLPIKQGYGEHEKTTWVICKIFGKRAEGQLPNYLKKGTKVTVSGEFLIEEWTGNDGVQNKIPVIIVNQLDFASQNNANHKNSNYATSNETTQHNNGGVDFNDEIPF